MNDELQKIAEEFKELPEMIRRFRNAMLKLSPHSDDYCGISFSCYGYGHSRGASFEIRAYYGDEDMFNEASINDLLESVSEMEREVAK